jgi:pyruvate dehydrogenase E2 component (dihydrolipoamide acetyltransferase)
MPDFLLPDLGEGLEEAEVISWRVQVGDQVAVDQLVAEVETAKAVVELPIPFAGRVSALHAEPGTTVAVGAPLISVASDAQQSPGLREPGITTAAEAPQEDETSGSLLIGFGTSPSPRRARSARRRAALAASRTAPPAEASADVAGSPALPPSTSAVPPAVSADTARVGPVPVISPLVRKRARDAGLDLMRIAGTGPNGLVRRRDVEEAIAASAKPASALPQQKPPVEAGAIPGASPRPLTARGAGSEVRVPLRGARRAAADKLARSRREIPEATVWVDADATGLLEARDVLNAQAPQAPVSLLSLLARFAIAGLYRYPELNARIDSDEIVMPADVHLGIASQTQRGLVVPVIRNAHLMSTRELAAAVREQTTAARSGSLAPADLTGGTITVNNYGVFGVDGSAAIINYPEVAILGMGRIIDRPWAVAGEVVVRKVTELTLAFDHRVCDGGTAGGYLRYVADCVESPVRALGDL